MTLYTFPAAAAYTGLTVNQLKNHYYTSRYQPLRLVALVIPSEGKRAGAILFDGKGLRWYTRIRGVLSSGPRAKGFYDQMLRHDPPPPPPTM